MPKVLSSPKLPSGKGGGRRNFRLSPLEIGVAILVAMGGVYLLYILLSGFWSGSEAPAPAGMTSGPGVSPARLDRVLSAAERAERRGREVERRLVGLDKRLTNAIENGAITAEGKNGGKGKSNPRLAARVGNLEKKLAALEKAPVGKGASSAKLAARLTGLEKQMASLDKSAQKQGKAEAALQKRLAGAEKSLAALNQQSGSLAGEVNKLAKAKSAAAAKDQAALAKRLDKVEKQLDQLAKAKSTVSAKDTAAMTQRLAKMEKQLNQLAKAKGTAPAKNTVALDKRLDQVEKQVLALDQRPAASAGTAGVAKVPPRLLNQVEGHGMVLSGVTSTLGKLERQQERRDRQVADLEKRLNALAQGKTAAKGAAPAAADAKLNQRLNDLEKRLAALSQQGGKLDQGAAARLAALEKGLARVRRDTAAARQADPKLAARIASMERKQAQDDRQEQSVGRRLAQLEKRVSVVASRPASRASTAASPPQLVRIIHTVRPGQTLYGLARTYGTRMSQIKAWNPRLGQRDKLYIGEKLVIYVRR